MNVTKTPTFAFLVPAPTPPGASNASVPLALSCLIMDGDASVSCGVTSLAVCPLDGLNVDSEASCSGFVMIKYLSISDTQSAVRARTYQEYLKWTNVLEQSVTTVSTMFRFYAKRKIILVYHFHLVAGMRCYVSVHELPRASFNLLDVKFVVFGQP